MELLGVIVLIVSFIALLIIGVPIAFSIGISAVLTMFVGIAPMATFTTIAQRMATSLDSFPLLAIPFFVFAGQLMNSGGIAKRLINLAKVLVGWIPGGLAFVNIIANMLFGAISGSAAASASAIGGFMSPVMEKENYPKPFSAAVNITSATTGLIIPPSNILIVYSLASGGVSIAALFIAGYLPGILIGLSLMLVAGYYARRMDLTVGEKVSFSSALRKFFDAIPSLFLLVIVIGGIVAGYFTATEASGIAVVYTLALAMIYREIKIKDLPKIILNTVEIVSIVLLLVSASMALSWVMSYQNIPQSMSEFMLGISDNKFVILLIINMVLLFVGVFMDMTPAVLIFTPIFLPAVVQLGIHPIHFGIIMVLNLSVGLCTPPVGSLLFIGCSVGKVSIGQVIKPMLPFWLVMIITLLLITYFPQISLWLPGVFGL
ncbi:MAG: TRAP transporter large permease subunit [Bacteroidetes bacterium]|mgnify:CR=1 FL=1|jgi:tripartite ATP-independent transporter DctM subunit|nr:TRAP transporter large permease subunit [Bacteroidota bacterium]MBT3749366.1 TRAP transporter large permease subunit [Bacteroidota bacterium]MBT4398844.1 TRAP transporter large permease subunit [Bacteroidota bacterium]MBT4410374.1 TRAP transporter large permease subunit [Bacteroidota bacterium]MBT7091729.1 TRAP transporter large permease subunit [Bacteroidota bacterium]